MAYGPGDRPGKVTRRKPAPPSFPTFVPDRPGQTPGEKTSERKRAKRVALSAQRKRTGGDRPILVKRRQAKAKETAPAEAYASLGAAVEHAAEQQRRGLALGAPEHEAAAARVLHAALHGAGEAAHVAGQGITGAAGAAGEATRQAVTGDFWLKHIGLDRPHEGAAESVVKLAGNIAPDIGELAVTAPSSVAKLASTAATDPKRLPGLLVEPYKELAHDPVGFITEHPASAALMLAPGVRVPGRVAGRVARVAGKQTLEREAATLPGTPLREARTGARGVVRRSVQAKREQGASAPEMTQREVERRVDELYDYARQRRPQVADSARQEAQRRGYDEQQTKTHISGALGGDLAHQFRTEFGDTPPDYAVKRLAHHQKVGTSPAVGAKVRRIGGRSFRSAVLPASLKWLTGQVIEPGVRAVATGAGPTSWLRERKVFKELEADEPGAGVAFRQRTSGGGQLGLTGTAREFAQGKSLAEEFPDSRLAAGVSRAAAAPGIRHVRQGWRAYSDAIFNTVNGTIERHARRTLAGKAIATGPLMERHLLTLSDAAIRDAAEGLRHTENQVALGRSLDDLYGRYSKFSPSTRETLLYTTPFAPWYFNALNFTLRVLPRDHPVSAALLANITTLEEDWRKAHGMSLRGGERRPGFLLGGYPTEDGAVVRIGRYTPALPSDVAGAVSDLIYPQFRTPVENLAGLDWKGQRLRKGDREYTTPERFIEAGKSAAEAHIPGVGQIGRALTREGSVAHRLRAEVDPFMPTGKAPGAGTVKRKGALRAAKPLRYRDSAPLTLR